MVTTIPRRRYTTTSWRRSNSVAALQGCRGTQLRRCRNKEFSSGAFTVPFRNVRYRENCARCRASGVRDGLFTVYAVDIIVAGVGAVIQRRSGP